MQKKQSSHRKALTKMLIQCGGLLSKSGLLEAFNITPGDDLQAYENRPEALQLLGFLTTCFEEKEFDEYNLERWQSIGERRL